MISVILCIIIHCEPSLEPHREMVPVKGHHIFYLQIDVNELPKLLFISTSSYLELWYWMPAYPKIYCQHSSVGESAFRSAIHAILSARL